MGHETLCTSWIVASQLGSRLGHAAVCRCRAASTALTPQHRTPLLSYWKSMCTSAANREFQLGARYLAAVLMQLAGDQYWEFVGVIWYVIPASLHHVLGQFDQLIHACSLALRWYWWWRWAELGLWGVVCDGLDGLGWMGWAGWGGLAGLSWLGRQDWAGWAELDRAEWTGLDWVGKRREGRDGWCPSCILSL